MKRACTVWDFNPPGRIDGGRTGAQSDKGTRADGYSSGNVNRARLSAVHASKWIRGRSPGYVPGWRSWNQIARELGIGKGTAQRAFDSLPKTLPADSTFH
jgi:hypothetical protein